MFSSTLTNIASLHSLTKDTCFMRPASHLCLNPPPPHTMEVSRRMCLQAVPAFAAAGVLCRTGRPRPAGVNCLELFNPCNSLRGISLQQAFRPRHPQKTPLQHPKNPALQHHSSHSSWVFAGFSSPRISPFRGRHPEPIYARTGPGNGCLSCFGRNALQLKSSKASIPKPKVFGNGHHRKRSGGNIQS